MSLDRARRLFPVSIHAPAWGATLNETVGGMQMMFQSTLPHGERQVAISALKAKEAFQSTLPHGERLSLACRFFG